MVKKKRKTTGKMSVTLSLTSQALDRLAEMAQKLGFSRSAFVENLMAGEVAIAAPDAGKNLTVVVEDEATDSPNIQVLLSEQVPATASTSAPVEVTLAPIEIDNSLQEKVTEQAQIIAALEAKLTAKVVADISALKDPVAHPTEDASGNDQLTKGLAENVQKIEDLQSHLVSKEAAIKTLETSVQSLNQNLAEITKKYEKNQQELEAKLTQVRENQEQNQVLENQLQEQYSRVSDLAKEVAQKEAVNQASEQLKLQLQQQQETVDQLTTQLATSQQIQSQLENDLAIAKSTQEQNQILENQLQEQYSRVSNLAKEVAQQKAVNQASEQLKLQLQQQQETVDQLTNQLATSQQIQSQLENDLAIAKSTQKQNQILENQLQEQYSRVSNLAKEVAQQKAINQAAEQLQLQLQQQYEIVDQLTTQLATSQQIQSQLEYDLAIAQSSAKLLQTQLETATLELNDGKGDLAQKITAIATLEQDLTTHHALNANLKQQLHSEQAAVQSLQAQLGEVSNLKAAYATLQADYHRQGDRLKEVEASVNAVNSVTNIGEFYLNRWNKR